MSNPTVARYVASGPTRKFPASVYREMSLYEDLRVLTTESIIPFFLNMVFSFSVLSPENLKKLFNQIDFTEIDQPDNEAQAQIFNEMAPFIFIYVAALIPKNATNSLMRFQVNREKGLLRMMRLMRLPENEGYYIIPKNALESLQEFMNVHSNVMAHTFKLFFGFCNQAVVTSVAMYAQEVVGQLKYANMNGVDVIEELIIERHPCIADTMISGLIRHYLEFKERAIAAFGHSWVFIALLDKSAWNNFSRSQSYRKLRIIATMFLSDFHVTYANITIDGEEISSFKEKGQFQVLYQAYTLANQKLHQTKNEFISKSFAQQIRSRANLWNAGDNMMESDSDSD